MTSQLLKKRPITRPNSKRRIALEPDDRVRQCGNWKSENGQPTLSQISRLFLFPAGLAWVFSSLVAVNTLHANATDSNFSATSFSPVNVSHQESELQWQRPILESTTSDAKTSIPTHTDITAHQPTESDRDRADSLYDESLWNDENLPAAMADVHEGSETIDQNSIELVSTSVASGNLVETGTLVEAGTGHPEQHPEEKDRSIRVAVWDDPFDDEPDHDGGDNGVADENGPDDLFEEPLIEETNDSHGQDENLDHESNMEDESGIPEFEPAEGNADPEWEPELPQNHDPGPEGELPSAPDQLESGSNSPPSTLRTIERPVPTTVPPSDGGQPEEDTPPLPDLRLEDSSTSTAETLPEETIEEDHLEDSLSAQEFAESRKNCEEELAQLRSAHIDSIDLNIRVKGKPGKDFPYECSLGSDRFSPRSWPQATYLWKASGLCHKPLYFEQVQLERYGHSWGPYVQPLVSGAHFFTTLPILPYKMGLKTPNECVYSLGYYRPGSCAPYLLDPVPFTWRAALFETAFIGGAISLIP